MGEARRKKLNPKLVFPEHERDILVWPDGKWCFRHERVGLGYPEEGYTRLVEGSGAWMTHIDMSWNG